MSVTNSVSKETNASFFYFSIPDCWTYALVGIDDWQGVDTPCNAEHSFFCIVSIIDNDQTTTLIMDTSPPNEQTTLSAMGNAYNVQIYVSIKASWIQFFYTDRKDCFSRHTLI